MLRRISQRLHARIVRSLTQSRERHGIALSMYIEAAPLDEEHLWPQLEAALDVIASNSPMWIRRMMRIGNSVHIRRIPGTRAMLTEGRFTILDPYLLADFLPAQIAASIVHEATHAMLHARGVAYDPQAPSRHERACRRAELRFGRTLLGAGVNGAQAVIDRAQDALALPDDGVGVVIDHAELRAIQIVTRLNDLPIPRWWKRRIARRYGVHESPRARAAFGG